MKNWRILLLNLIIVLIVVAGFSFYLDKTNETYARATAKGFKNTAIGMQKNITGYMTSEQQLVDSWAGVINGMPMTINDVIDFARLAIGESDAEVHVVWADDYSKGLSTRAHALDEKDYTVSYDITDTHREYEVSPKQALERLDFNKPGVHLTNSYTNPTTGCQVISFCQKIRLVSLTKKREAILIYVLPAKYLEEKWILASEYADVDFAVIEKNGNYILRPDTMKKTNFFDFICSFNDLEQKAVQQLVFEGQSGSFDAIDDLGVETLYSSAVVEATGDHALILCMPKDNLKSDGKEWIIVVIALVTLLLAVSLNTILFSQAYKNERIQYQFIQEQGKQLEAALAKAQQSNRSKTIFLNNMSHDIRTPMNAIIGFTSLAEKHIDEKEMVIDYLSKISTSSKHLLTLINDVLDMSHIESGKMKILEQAANLNEIMKDIQSIIQTDMNTRSLEFTVDMSQVSHPDVYCDKLRLNQVLINLLSNSMKFTKAGGRVSVVVSEYTEGNDEKYVFHVKDTGIGMSPEFLKRIFEPFERERTSTVSGIQGTGLGMSITKKIVDMMNGSISVESEEGIGTEFKVEIPLRINEDAAVYADEAELIDVEKFKGKRILLVEDNELNQEIATAILEEAGFVVSLASDGAAAVEMVKASSPGDIDCILMDIQMPVMNGYDATRAIRALDSTIKSSIPIFAMTANAFEEDKRDAINAGMDGHISKPVKVEVLMKTLAGIIK